MFIAPQQQINALFVEDDFALLTGVSDTGDLTFTFTYSFSQTKALQNGCSFVFVTVSTQVLQKTQIVPVGTTVNYNTTDMIQNILQSVSNASDAYQAQTATYVSRTPSSLLSVINNDLMGKLSQPLAQPSSISGLKKNFLKSVKSKDLKAKNDIRPVLDNIAYKDITDVQQQISSSLFDDPRTLAHEMLFQDGIDPSEIVSLTSRNVTAREARAGTLKKTKSREISTDTITKLANYYMFGANALTIGKTTANVPNSNTQQVVVTETVDVVDVNVPVTILSPKQDPSSDILQYFVTFDLICDGTGLPIASITKVLDLQKQLNLFYVPKTPPQIRAIGTSTTSTILEIKQIDTNADGVLVFKKTLQKDEFVEASYDQFGSFDLLAGNSIKISVQRPTKSTDVYRVISTRQQKESFEFTNIVVEPTHTYFDKSISVATFNTTTGVTVALRNIPRAVISIQFLVRDLTLFEKDFVELSEPLVVDDTVRSSDSLTYIDQSVRDGDVYEYVAKLFFTSGVQELSRTSVIAYTPFAAGKASTVITNTTVDHSDVPNVEFDITTTLSNNNSDTILSLLKEQDLYDLFGDNVKDERAFLSGLIAHNVQRVNVSTGLREDFGVVTGTHFSDKILQEAASVLPLEYGYTYKYEIFVLLRAIETLFSTLKKEITDPVTNKTYTQNVLKFLHPIVAKEGMLVSQAGLSVNYPQSTMEHGLIGLTVGVDVSFEKDVVKILDASAVKYNRRTNIISLNTQGNIASVDHFLIMTEIHGIRTFVGKTRTQSYEHAVSEKDYGELKYVCVPVYLDYSVGSPTLTNSLVLP